MHNGSCRVVIHLSPALFLVMPFRTACASLERGRNPVLACLPRLPIPTAEEGRSLPWFFANAGEPGFLTDCSSPGSIALDLLIAAIRSLRRSGFCASTFSRLLPALLRDRTLSPLGPSAWRRFEGRELGSRDAYARADIGWTFVRLRLRLPVMALSVCK